LETIIRRQLTLFVDKKYSHEIENVRRQFNPKQQTLIDSHVTLCREDEIQNINALFDNLQQLDTPKIIINFGQVIRFENGRGVMLPAFGDNEQFHLLRSTILYDLGITVRSPEPHITLMHPRNSTCTDEIFSVIQKISFPTHLMFNTISLIEQSNGTQWKILKSYKLNDN
jgi:hypothetical protein